MSYQEAYRNWGDKSDEVQTYYGVVRIIGLNDGVPEGWRLLTI